MKIFKRFWNWLFGSKEETPLERTAVPKFKKYKHTAHGTSRRMHRRAVRECINGRPLAANHIAEELNKTNGMFNCGDTLRRKFKKSVARMQA